MNPGVFLDRDDTLIDTRGATAGSPHPGDLFDPALVRLLPGAAAACRRLANAGYRLVVVSNQGCVGAGLCAPAAVEATNDRLRALLRQEHGVELAGAYFSPARPGGRDPRFAQDPLGWRKPAPGMILAAARELDLDLSASWVVGDSERDVQAGVAAGIPATRCILVGPGRTPPDLAGAAALILGSA